MSNIFTLMKRASERYQEEGLGSTFRAVIRAALRKLEDGPPKKNQAVQNIDFSAYLAGTDPKESRSYDVVLVTDIRFPGGSSSSSAQEILIQEKAGLRSGIFDMPTFKMRHRSSPSPTIDSILESNKADILNMHEGALETQLLLFRHPAVLNPDGLVLPNIRTNSVGLIVNHPPIKFGQIEYLLPYAIKRLRDAYGVEPYVFPIGPLVRDQIEQVYDNTIKMADFDWVNVFDIDRFAFDRQPPRRDRALRIGRHSRPNVEKWPADATVIRTVYPERADIEVHILGGADIPKSILGEIPSNWTVHEFGDLDPADFLREIDVFVYFHHPDWVEAFGRVIVEAMAAGLPVILPPHFEPLLGDAGIYCQPETVSGELMRLRDPDYYIQKSQLCRETALRRFSTDVHLERIAALCGRTNAADIRSTETHSQSKMVDK